ncbi:hypothetical protein STANM309S_05005 [Streptomyces tanashiensis]
MYGAASTNSLGTSSVRKYQRKKATEKPAETAATTHFFLYSCQRAAITRSSATSSSSAWTFSAPPRSLRLSVKPKRLAPSAMPPGIQLPKIIAARPM